MAQKKQPAIKKSVGSGVNITNSNPVEESLRASEEHFRLIVNNSRDMIFTMNLRGEFIFVSPAVKEFLGYDPAELQKLPFQSIVHPDDLTACQAAIKKNIEKGERTPGFEYRVKDKAGHWRWHITSGSAVRDAHGSFLHFLGIAKDITKSKQLEKELRDSEAKFRNIIELSGDMFYIFDLNARPLYLSPRAIEMLGYTVDEFFQIKWTDHLTDSPVNRAALASTVAAIKTGQKQPPYPIEFRRKDGAVLSAEINESPLKDPDGKVTGLVGVMRDTGERKKAEEAMRNSEERFRNMANLLPQTVFETDEKSNFTFVNRQGFEMFGYSEADVAAGMSVLETIIPQDRDRAVENISLRIGGKESPPQEYTAVRKDGSKFPATIYAAPIIINSSYAGMRGMLIDITENKRTEEALRGSEEKYRTVVENAQEAILIAVEGIIKFANRKTEEITGYSQEELISRPFAEFIHPDDRQMLTRQYNQRLEGISVQNLYAFRIVRKSGEIKWVEPSGAVITWEGKPATLHFVTDITDRRRLEEEQQRVAKLESVGLLAGGIAHDFNNILTAILGNISLAGMEAAPGSELQNSLDQAEKASLRAKDLTKQLLTFSRGGAPVTKLASLTELLRDTASFALRGSNVKCNFSIPADLWHAEIDEGQISQVIHNLVINAQQAMPTGGTIKLTAENMALSETQSIGKGLPLKAGDYIRIAVVDHGTGIPAEHLDRIFDPFFSTKQKGSGLGLATSFSIARRHGGHISVESQSGSGSTFYLYLPASTQTAALKPDKKEAMKPAGRARILVMDDEKGVRDIAGRMLQHLGYEDVEFAADGAEAVKLYKAAMKSGSPFTVAILDLTIAGGMGGEVAVKKLLKIDPGVKAIVSSGYVDDSVIAKYKDYGFSGMVAKPYTLDELHKTLQDVIG